MGHDRSLACVFAAILAAGILFPPAFEPFGAIAKVFTEGNSWAKHFALASFLAAVFFARAGFPGFASGNGKNRSRYTALFVAASAAGFLFGLALQVYAQNALGQGPSSYISLVTDCGRSACWEASYLQHNHFVKSAIYYAENASGVYLPASADDGRPAYEMLASPPISVPEAVFPVMLLLLGLAGALAFLLAVSQPSAHKALLAALAGAVTLSAVLDGGIFSLAGAASLSLLAAFMIAGQPASKYQLLLPAAAWLVPVSVSWLPYHLLGTGLYFREWATAPSLVASASLFSIVRGRRDAVFLASVTLLAASSMLALSDASRNWLGEYSYAPKMLVYGVPEDSTDAQLAQATGLPLLGRHGWYAVFGRDSAFNAAAESTRLRQALSPSGYLYCEPAGVPAAQRELSVYWITRPPEALFQTASYSGVSGLRMGAMDYLRGEATVNYAQLALEYGSAIASGGGKAIVASSMT